MREIYFRGKDEWGNWREGDLIFATLGAGQKPMIMDAYDEFDLANNMFEVAPETVGQSTGLYDTDGREIYEGDVLNTLYGHLGVSYKQEWAAFVACGVDKTGYYHEYLLDEIVNTPVRRAEIKVIGNIHDDPGLLEG